MNYKECLETSSPNLAKKCTSRLLMVKATLIVEATTYSACWLSSQRHREIARVRPSLTTPCSTSFRQTQRARRCPTFRSRNLQWRQLTRKSNNPRKIRCKPLIYSVKINKSNQYRPLGRKSLRLSLPKKKKSRPWSKCPQHPLRMPVNATTCPILCKLREVWSNKAQPRPQISSLQRMRKKSSVC